MIDNPKPDLETVRGIVEQIAKGLARLSPQGDAAPGPPARQHHDRQDRNGEDHRFRFDQDHRRRRSRAVRQTATTFWARQQYTAPEYFLGEGGYAALRHVLARRHHLSDADGKTALRRADRESENAITVQQAEIPLRLDDNREIPAWIDGALERAVHPGSLQALRELVGIHLRPSSSQCEISQSRHRRR